MFFNLGQATNGSLDKPGTDYEVNGEVRMFLWSPRFAMLLILQKHLLKQFFCIFFYDSALQGLREAIKNRDAVSVKRLLNQVLNCQSHGLTTYV